MVVILNKEQMFYTNNSGGKMFTNYFTKAAMFKNSQEAIDEWNKNGIMDYDVTISDVG